MEFGSMIESHKDYLNEKLLRRTLIQKWQGWIDWLEPSVGFGSGRPDCDILVDGIIFPVELKVGEKDGYIFTIKSLKKSQIVWHTLFNNKGGISCFLIKTNCGIYLCHKIKYQSGSCVEFEFVSQIDSRNFSEDLFFSLRRIKNKFF